MPQLRYWNGSAWVDAVVGTAGPQGTTGPQGVQGITGSVTLSNSNPLGLGTAAPGTSTSASRSDHVHPGQSITGDDDQIILATQVFS